MHCDSINVWVLRPFPDMVDSYKEFLDDGFIAIGWPKLSNLENLGNSENIGQLKKRLKETHPIYDSPQKLGQAAGKIWRFVVDINVGDVVLVPHWGEFSVGLISSPYIYNPYPSRPHAKHCREVTWLHKRLTRSGLSEQLTVALKGQGTLYSPKLDGNLISSIASQEWTHFHKNEEADSISSFIDNMLEKMNSGTYKGINQSSLETIIGSIIQNGVESFHLPTTNTKGKGDADVEVNILPGLKLCVQVKYHYRGKVSKSAVDKAVDQIYNAVEYRISKNSQGDDEYLTQYIPIVIIVGKLDDISPGWQEYKGMQVLLLTIHDLQENIHNWIKSLDAIGIIKLFPSI